MNALKTILLTSFLVMLASSFAGPALADNAQAPSDISTGTERKNPDAPKPEPAEAFVDRDGDGISDGLEHRFRKQSKRRQGSDKKQTKQKRNQKKGSGSGARNR
jgi:hypothetical protein